MRRLALLLAVFLAACSTTQVPIANTNVERVFVTHQVYVPPVVVAAVPVHVNEAGAIGLHLPGGLPASSIGCPYPIDANCSLAQNPTLSDGTPFQPYECDAHFSPTRSLSNIWLYFLTSGQLSNNTTDVAAYDARQHINGDNIVVKDYCSGAPAAGTGLSGALKPMVVGGVNQFNLAHVSDGCTAWKGGDPSMPSDAATYFKTGAPGGITPNVIRCGPSGTTGTYDWHIEDWDLTDWGAGTNTESTFVYDIGNNSGGSAITKLTILANKWQCRTFTNSNGTFTCDHHYGFGVGDSGFVKAVTGGSRASNIVFKFNTLTGNACPTDDFTSPNNQQNAQLWLADDRGQNNNVDANSQPSTDLEFNALWCMSGDWGQSGLASANGGNIISRNNAGEYAVASGVHGEQFEKGGYAPNQVDIYDYNLTQWSSNNGIGDDLTSDVYLSQGSAWGLVVANFERKFNHFVMNDTDCTGLPPYSFPNKCNGTSAAGGTALFSMTFLSSLLANEVSGNVMDIGTKGFCYTATNTNGPHWSGGTTETVDVNGNLLIQGYAGTSTSNDIYPGNAIGGTDATKSSSQGANTTFTNGSTTAVINFYSGATLVVGDYMWSLAFPGPTHQAQLLSYSKVGSTATITFTVAASSGGLQFARYSTIPLNNSDGSFQGFRIKLLTDPGSLTTWSPFTRVPVTWNGARTIFDTGAGNLYDFQVGDTVLYVQPAPLFPQPSGLPASGTIASADADGHHYTVNAASNGNGAIQHVNPRAVGAAHGCIIGIDFSCGVIDIGGGLLGKGITVLDTTAFTPQAYVVGGINVVTPNYSFNGLLGTPQVVGFQDILTSTNNGQPIKTGSCH